MNIYFSGIGGVGLGPLAQMAIDAGYTVSGSDLSDSLTVQELTAQGVNVHIGDQTGEYLRTVNDQSAIDWFVYTAALPADHPELVAAIKLGIKATKRDGLLAQLIEDSGQKLIAVAGTHGKTTTTGMLVWAFNQLDIPASYSIGSQLGFGPSGKFDRRAEYFIYECDEFDRNFLKFDPHLSIIVSLDYDHPDTYPTEAEYKSAFRQFIHQSEATVLWQHDADYAASRESSAWCLQPDELVALPLAGEHNRQNATLVLKALERLKLGENSDNRTAVASFPGTKRRFERLADNLYSDYGHHPVEIKATLQMARELSDYVVLVYQPHQNVRQHEVKDQYVDGVFEDAGEIYWLPTYLSREDSHLEVLTPTQLTSQLSTDNLHIAEFNDDLWNEIIRHREAGHLVLCMGAGSIDDWTRKRL
jgi:UDP-N-acetylmuramate--alanine ligase